MKAVFLPAIEAPSPMQKSAMWFVFQGNSLLVASHGGQASVPLAADLSSLRLVPLSRQYLGTADGFPCFCAEIAPGPAPEGWSFSGLRALFGSLGEDYFRIAGKASQIVDWGRAHRFCGRCGTETAMKPGERARECPACGLLAYPRISPAVIVAVVRERRLLLAHSARFTKGFFSVLAGFVEAGETLEECIHREVSEEVGIEIREPRYFGSQPWPFPNSLMIAFTAAHASGEIAIDGVEIEQADWYSATALPEKLPDRLSIARRLIDWFISTQA